MHIAELALRTGRQRSCRASNCAGVVEQTCEHQQGREVILSDGRDSGAAEIWGGERFLLARSLSLLPLSAGCDHLPVTMRPS